ncbi:MAG: sugar transferase [Thermomicrobiales bacterium]
MEQLVFPNHDAVTTGMLCRYTRIRGEWGCGTATVRPLHRPVRMRWRAESSFSGLGTARARNGRASTLGGTMALPAELGASEHLKMRGSADLRGADGGDYGNLLAFPATSEDAIGTANDRAVETMRHPGRIYPYAKYAIDVVAASILFILVLPVLVIIAFAIALTSPGGVFFRQTRVGKNMRPFQCLKFRTMVPNAETILAQDSELARIHALNWKLDNDPRVTKIGKFLRKTSLDELPQLVNVINGEMSLIGPRPYMPKELSDEFGHHAAAITAVRPGMTGLWQVSGRAHLTPHQRILLDQEYASASTFALDIQIALRTVTVVTIGRGAF